MPAPLGSSFPPRSAARSPRPAAAPGRRDVLLRRRRRLAIETLEERRMLAAWSGDVPDGTIWSNTEVQRLTGTVRVPAGATLTIQPGTIIKANSFPHIRLHVEGTLIAEGTIAQPILFTAFRDDAGFDGVLNTADDQDSNGDGATQGAPDDWGGVTFAAGSGASRLEHFEFRWGGWGSGGSAVLIQGGGVTLSNGKIRGTGDSGVRVAGGSPALTDLEFVGNTGAAVSMALNADPALARVNFVSNGVNGVYVDAGTLTSDANWNDPDAVYMLSGDVTVPAGRTLTLGAGQIVKSFSTSGFIVTSNLLVDGRLVSQGTAEHPVVFTSRRDDSLGGDTTSDGSTTGVRGDWGTIRLSASSAANVLDHLHVRYGGGFNVSGALQFLTGDVQMRGGGVAESNRAGIRVGAGTPLVQDVTFTNNAQSAISLHLAANPLIVGGTYVGNGVNGVLVDAGALTADTAWDDPDVVYQLNGDVTVPAGRTLTIGAGQIIKSFTISGFIVSCNLIIDGRLIADGTFARPIIFTSRRDDTAGGDTNNDGASTAVPGDWGGLRFGATSTGNVLDRVEIRYGGHSSSGSPPAVRVDGGSLTLTNSVVRDMATSGVVARTRGRIDASNNLIYRNVFGTGLRAESGATVTAINNTLNGNLQGAVSTGVESVVELTNNLLTFHGRSGVAASSGGVVRVRHNDVYNPTSSHGNYEGLPAVTGTNGNLSADPLYVDRTVGDFRLAANSPAIDAGDSAGAPEDDFGFRWRVDDAAVANTGAGLAPYFDLGAREFGGPPRAVAHDPDGPVAASVRLLRFEFREAIDPATFSIAHDLLEFTGPTGPIIPTAVRWKNPYEMELDLPEQAAAGDYHFVLDSQILNTSGQPLDGDGDGVRGEAGEDRYAAGFTILPPRIAGHTPDDFLGGPLDRLTLAFDRAMTPASFALDDVERFVGPDGPIPLTGYSWLDDRTLEVQFAPRTTYGFYELTVRPTMSSTAGDALDQDGDGVPGEALADRYFASFTLANVTRISGEVTNDRTLEGLVIVEDSVTVRSPATLTIAPGAIVKIYDLKGITVDAGATLVAEGSVASPIRFTSIHDDTLGGDTDRNGDRVPPQPGAWTSLHFNGGTGRFASTLVRYGGGSASGTWNFSAMIRATGAANVQIVGSTLADSFFDGVLAQGGTTTLTNTVVRGSDRGVVAWLSAARVDVAHAVFDDNRIGVLAHGGTLNVVNSLVTNSHLVGVDNDIAPAPTLRFTDLFNPAGLNVRGFANPIGANGNRAIDPDYVDSSAGDYRLDYQSPAIDAADGASAPATDLRGAPRYDDPRSVNTGTLAGNGAPADRGAYEFVEGAPSDVDFVVTSLSAPSHGEVGLPFTIDVTVRNAGIAVAGGGWNDAAYLSRDAAWSPDDLLIGSLMHADELGPNLTYSFTLTAALPEIVPGEYYVLVRPNADFSLFEGVNAANNVRAAATRTAVAWDLPELALDVPAVGRFTPDDAVHYYRVAVPTGVSLEITLDSAATSGSSELFLKRGALPAASSFDATHDRFAEPDQRLVLAETGPGVYYLQVSAEYGATRNAEYTLTARAGQFGLTRILPTAGANAGETTIEVAGVSLTPETRVELFAGAAILTPIRTSWRDSTSLYATFDLSGATLGAYSLRAIGPSDETSTLADAFTVKTGIVGNVRTQIVQPANARPNRDGRLTIEYVNDGDTDAVAPLVGVTAHGALLKFPADVGFGGAAVQFLGLNRTGPADVLPPHATYFVTLDFRPQTEGNAIVFDAKVVPADDAVANLDAYQDALRPAGVDPEGWDALWTNFVAATGATVASFQAELLENAVYLHDIGAPVIDVSRLLGFELRQAAASLPVDSLVGTTDFSLATSGAPLQWDRSFAHPLTGRYELGPFGRGWTHGWNVAASEDADGNVTIGGGGSDRRFRRRADGTFQSSAGDAATLTREGGLLTLSEPAGTKFVFRSDGLPDYLEDASGARTTATYADGRLVRLTSSDGPALDLEYDAAGRIASITDGTRTVTYEYDASGEHLVRVIAPEATTTYEYDLGSVPARRHALLSVESTVGERSEFAYDAQGRLTRVAGRDDTAAITLSYPGPGSVSVVDSSGPAVTFDFDASGQIVRVRDAAGQVNRFRYDASGRLLESFGPNGLGSLKQYDAAGNLVRTVDAEGGETTVEIDPETGRTTATVDRSGDRYEYEYDAAGNLRSVTDPDGAVRTLVFDDYGLLESVRNARGQEVRYRYDDQGRVIEKLRPDGSRDSFVYDAAGRLASYADARGTTTLTHDAAGRLVRINYPAGEFLQYAYNAEGLRSRLEDQTGFVVQYAYDALGRLTALTDAVGALVVRYAYDDAGRLALETKGNGTSTTYQYDALGRVAGMKNHASGGAVTSKFEYGYDALGRRVSVATLDGVTHYEYDDFGRVTAATEPGGLRSEYQYDEQGELLAVVEQGDSVSYVRDEQGRILQVGDATYQFDADGNIVARIADGVTRTYEYDAESRLSSSTGPEGTTTYEYDALGKLVARTLAGQRIDIFADPLQPEFPLAEIPAGGSPVHFTVGHGLVSRTASPPNYYEYDPDGNTIALTNTAGTPVNVYRYSPVGGVASRTEAAPNRFEARGRFGGATLHDEAPPPDQADLLQHRTQQLSYRIDADLAGVRGGVSEPPAWSDLHPLDAVLRGITSGAEIFSILNGHVMASLATAGAAIETAGRGMVHSVELGARGSVGGVLNIPFQAAIGWFKFSHPEMDPLGHTFLDFLSSTASAGSFLLAAAGGGDPYAPGASYLRSTFQQLAYRFTPFAATRNALLTRVFSTAPVVGGIISAANVGWTAGRFLDELIQSTDTGREQMELVFDYWCGALFLCESVEGTTALVRSFDPNEIIGPAGVGDEGWLRPGSDMPYTILFENKATAEAPAQDVFVTNDLDPELDWSTFELTSAGFNALTIEVPPGRQKYATHVTTTNPDGSPLRVEFSAELNRQTGRLTWSFRSVDPFTGEPPLDPFAGFLPPNDATHRGEGFVSYRVRSQGGSPTGTTIESQASIVFDTNAPIITNTASNRLDGGFPSAAVVPLPPVSPAEFDVAWTGIDDSDGTAGSGIASYDVWVSIDGGSFSLWLDDTETTTAKYSGLGGQTYRFYAVATDRLGHAELSAVLEEAATETTNRPWTNHRDPLDVNDDRHIAPIDALLIINHLNLIGSTQLPVVRPPAEPYLDPSGDLIVAPVDALLVINELNRDAQGEGEQAPSELFVAAPALPPNMASLGAPLPILAVPPLTRASTDLAEAARPIERPETFAPLERPGRSRVRRGDRPRVLVEVSPSLVDRLMAEENWFADDETLVNRPAPRT